MGILTILLIPVILLLLRVRAQAELTACEDVRLVFGLACIGVSKEWTMQTGKDGMILGGGSVPRILQPSVMRGGFGKMLRVMKRSDRARQLLLHHITLHRLTFDARVHGQDAARTALVTGTIRTLASFLPPRIRRSSRFAVTPGFHDMPSAVHIRCIISCRTGILFITAALLGIASIREKLAAGKED